MNDENTANEKLIAGARKNDTQTVIIALLSGANINYQSPENGWTAMHWCSHNLSHEVFSALVCQESELVLLRKFMFANVPSDFGDVDKIETQWINAISALDPLTLDNVGRVASACATSFHPFNDDVVSGSATKLVKKLISLEAASASNQGKNYFEIVCQSGLPMWPGIEI